MRRGFALGFLKSGRMAAASFRSSCVVILMLSAEPFTTAQRLAQGLDKLAVVRQLFADTRTLSIGFADDSRRKTWGVWAK